MRGAKGKTAVILDRQPLWLEAMADLLEGEGVQVIARAGDAETIGSMVEGLLQKRSIRIRRCSEVGPQAKMEHAL
jgi:hypothetical protein